MPTFLLSLAQTLQSRVSLKGVALSSSTWAECHQVMCLVWLDALIILGRFHPISS